MRGPDLQEENARLKAQVGLLKSVIEGFTEGHLDVMQRYLRVIASPQIFSASEESCTNTHKRF